MATDLSLIHLISNASILVQLVMLMLVVASFVSWTMIFRKRQILRRARAEADRFEDEFWSGKELSTLYTETNRSNEDPTGLVHIFHAGFQEFVRLRGQDWRIPQHVPCAIMGSLRKKQVPTTQLHVGEKLFLMITDPDQDASDERDVANVEISTALGEKETVQLVETLVHSGEFTGSFTLRSREEPQSSGSA